MGRGRPISLNYLHFKKLLNYYKENKDFILPQSRRNEVVSFVEKGLNDLSISRTSFSWGIPVPENKKHIIYVWLDALTNYLSALNFPNTEDEKYKSLACRCSYNWERYFTIPCNLLASIFICSKIAITQKSIWSWLDTFDDKKMSKSLKYIGSNRDNKKLWH